MRVLQARARQGIAVGGFFPQTQEAGGELTRSRRSLETSTPITGQYQTTWRAGFDAAWELDFWGRFRRSVEAADADLVAADADYDDVLVTLVSETAANYVRLRVFEDRLALARANVEVQREGLELARVRYEAGGTSALDVQQATTLLSDTEATIPALEASHRQAANALAVLLGVPPDGLGDRLAASNGIPEAPPTVAVGIPADLLRRRPDVRRSEGRLAAESARVGVAMSDLLPRIELVGSIGWSAEDAGDLFTGRSLEAVGGPRFAWPILNYGRIVNAVRLADAEFEEAAALHVDTVLRAQRDVEDALVRYLRGLDQVNRLGRAAGAAHQAVEISLIQYREGAADYTRVLNTQQAKLQEEDRLASSRGDVTLAVIALYKALGGGWELREGQKEIVPGRRFGEPLGAWW
jgi:NodT family efflux transporter outer membrane factor (OMF) lipoprotein